MRAIAMSSRWADHRENSPIFAADKHESNQPAAPPSQIGGGPAERLSLASASHRQSALLRRLRPPYPSPEEAALRNSRQSRRRSAVRAIPHPTGNQEPYRHRRTSVVTASVHLGNDHLLGYGLATVVGAAFPFRQFDAGMLDLVVIEKAQQMMDAI